MAQDPTKEEMLAFLEIQSCGDEGWQDDAEVAIYWFASFWHGGQSSNLYAALSSSTFSPASIADGPEPDSAEQMLFQDLENHFAGVPYPEESES